MLIHEQVESPKMTILLSIGSTAKCSMPECKCGTQRIVKRAWSSDPMQIFYFKAAGRQYQDKGAWEDEVHS
jgi:hypothetical protein